MLGGGTQGSYLSWASTRRSSKDVSEDPAIKAVPELKSQQQ